MHKPTKELKAHKRAKQEANKQHSSSRKNLPLETMLTRCPHHRQNPARCRKGGVLHAGRLWVRGRESSSNLMFAPNCFMREQEGQSVFHSPNCLVLQLGTCFLLVCSFSACSPPLWTHRGLSRCIASQTSVNQQSSLRLRAALDRAISCCSPVC
jgi:hypothetical protein